jgi:ParB-like chromosome segregation protein Spo0J
MSNAISLTIVYRAPAEIRPDPRNARTHSKRQTAEIATSIETFGFTNPILIDEANVIIAGHGRLLAAKALGLAQVPTITLRHLSDPQKRALRLADNKIALNAGWDTDLIKVELGELSCLDLGFPLEITGFSTGEIDVALSMGTGDPDDEIVPAVPSVPRTKLGDIWLRRQPRLRVSQCRGGSRSKS